MVHGAAGLGAGIPEGATLVVDRRMDRVDGEDEGAHRAVVDVALAGMLYDVGHEVVGLAHEAVEVGLAGRGPDLAQDVEEPVEDDVDALAALAGEALGDPGDARSDGAAEERQQSKRMLRCFTRRCCGAKPALRTRLHTATPVLAVTHASICREAHVGVVVALQVD